MPGEKIKVLTGKIGLDEHHRGIVWVSEVLRDAGMEVVYLGTNQSVASMVQTAIQEDVDVVGISFHCGGHLEATRRLVAQLKKRGMSHILVLVGGTIPSPDIPKLKRIGAGGVFVAGATSKDIVGHVVGNLHRRRRVPEEGKHPAHTALPGDGVPGR
ncbi:MAG: cobalamin-dependent protein [Chloroflexota bacterium]